MKIRPRIRIIQFAVSCAFFMHPIDSYVCSLEWIHCIALHCIFTFPFWRRHWPFPSAMFFFYFCFFLLLFSCYLAVVAPNVDCLPASHLLACERGSRCRRRRRRGWRNVSVFIIIKPEKCRMAVFPLSLHLPCLFRWRIRMANSLRRLWCSCWGKAEGV